MSFDGRGKHEINLKKVKILEMKNICPGNLFKLLTGFFFPNDRL